MRLNKDYINRSVVLGVILLLAVVIIISRELFPLIFLFGIVSLILGFLAGIWEHFTNPWENHSYYLFWVGVIFLFISGVFYLVVYSLGDSHLGKEILNFYYAFAGTQEEISNTHQ